MQIFEPYLVVWLPAAPLPEHGDADDGRRHQRNAGERQRHVHGVAAAPHLNATHRVSLKNEQKK